MAKKVVYSLGCDSFIGSHFTNHILKNCEVFGIDKGTYCSTNEWRNRVLSPYDFCFKDYFHFESVDINDLKRLEDADYVFNFAAESHVDNSITDQSAFISSNFLGVVNILSLIRQKPVWNRPLFIQISTDEVLGDEPPVTGFATGDRLNPSSPYAASKAAAEQWIMGYCKTFSIDYVIVRLANNYGPNQYPEKLIPLNIKRLVNGKKMILYGNGQNKRYWLHVRDTVSALEKLLNANREQIKNRIFHISSKVCKTNLEVLSIIAQQFQQVKSPKLLDGLKRLSQEDLQQHVKDNYCEIVPNRLAEDKIYDINDLGFRQEFNWTDSISQNFTDNIKQLVRDAVHKP